jgi:hypothetical protein
VYPLLSQTELALYEKKKGAAPSLVIIADTLTSPLHPSTTSSSSLLRAREHALSAVPRKFDLGSRSESSATPKRQAARSLARSPKGSSLAFSHDPRSPLFARDSRSNGTCCDRRREHGRRAERSLRGGREREPSGDAESCAESGVRSSLFKSADELQEMIL